MRLFFAVTLDEKVKTAIRTGQKSLATFPGVRPVPAENLHITLQFLGDTPQSDLTSLIALGEKVEVHRGNISVGGGLLGFPRPNRWTVAALTVRDSAELLSNIHRQLPVGDDKRGFTPHVTIARSSQPQAVLPNVEMEPISMAVDDFTLMESILRPQGPLYKVVHTFHLK